MVARRTLLGSLAATAGLAACPALALARGPSDRPLVILILRGAMDGLGVLVPYGDPAHATARRQLAMAAGEGERDARRLDGLFALHPALPQTLALWRAGEALFVPAVATAYRDRSHFDGQNVLETGGLAPYARKDGWLNRLLAALPPAGRPEAIAIAPAAPPLLRGALGVASYAPSRLPGASPELLARVGALWEADPVLHPLWGEAMAARALAAGMDPAAASVGPATASGARMEAGSGMMAGAADRPRPGYRGRGGPAGLPALASIAARFLTAPGGPRVAVIEHDGWDTHAQQAPRLAAQLAQLDAGLTALRSGLGPAWRDTLVLVVTEFGRTVAVNGTGGTDHGTAGLAMLMGGAIAGGRIVGDWPGLAPSALHEGRDLRPTVDMASLLAGALAQHWAVEPGLVARAAWPDTQALRPLAGLLRA
jgi:uncharacterized protein (DUF1501 family)